MNQSKNGAMKGYLITFGIALIANVVAGIVVAKFILKNEEKQLAQTQQKSQQVTVSTPPAGELDTNV